MDGIEKITTRIRGDAERETEQIIDRARREADEILESYKDIAASEKRESVERGKVQAAERTLRLKGVSDLEARKMLLAAKQEVLDLAFDRALDKLCALPEADYTKLLAGLAVRSSTSGSEKIILNSDDHARVGKGVVAQANDMLGTAGRPAGLTLSPETRAIRAGLILSDEEVEINCTFESLVRMSRDDLAGEVASLLFDAT